MRFLCLVLVERRRKKDGFLVEGVKNSQEHMGVLKNMREMMRKRWERH